MKLYEALEQYKGYDVKLGTNEGSAYVFCGASDANTIHTMRLISEKHYNSLSRQLFKLMYKMNNFDKLHELKENRIIAAWRDRDNEKVKEVKAYKKYLKLPTIVEVKERLAEEKARDYKRTTKQYAKLTDYLTGWTDFLERDVTTIYNSLTDYTYKILFEGIENGAYWTKQEYERANK